MAAPRLAVPQWTRAVQDATGRRRWLAIGRSGDPDSRRAGAYAAARALVASDPALLIVFCCGAADPAAVLAGVADVAAGVPLVGCSASDLVAPDGPGGGVVVAALGGQGFTVSVTTERGAAGREREAGAGAARCAVAAAPRPNQVLLLLTNGDASSHEAILTGAYSVVGAGLPMIGGAASPYAPSGQTFMLSGREVLDDGVVAAVIGSDGPIGVSSQHGFRKVGEPMIVTSASAGLVRTLDDEPALPAYLRRLGAPPEAYLEPEAFEQFARTHPLGVRRRTTVGLRHVERDEYPARGYLYSRGDVPEGAVVWVMEGDVESSLVAAEEAGRAAVAALGGLEPLGLLAFDCASRGTLLGEQAMREEIDRLGAAAGGAPVAGLYTWGEIARVRGIFGYHNQTIVAVALG